MQQQSQQQQQSIADCPKCNLPMEAQSTEETTGDAVVRVYECPRCGRLAAETTPREPNRRVS